MTSRELAAGEPGGYSAEKEDPINKNWEGKGMSTDQRQQNDQPEDYGEQDWIDGQEDLFEENIFKDYQTEEVFEEDSSPQEDETTWQPQTEVEEEEGNSERGRSPTATEDPQTTTKTYARTKRSAWSPERENEERDRSHEFKANKMGKSPYKPGYIFLTTQKKVVTTTELANKNITVYSINVGVEGIGSAAEELGEWAEEVKPTIIHIQEAGYIFSCFIE